MKYFDVKLMMFIGGYEKDTTNRIAAETEKEAIYEAFGGEVHNLDEMEVAQALDSSYKENGIYELDDGDAGGYRLMSVTPLQEVEVIINGLTATALLPEALYKNKHYFTSSLQPDKTKRHNQPNNKQTLLS